MPKIYAAITFTAHNENAYMVWRPHVTVAAVIEREQRFLMVEEHTPRGLQFNQPAGHLEEGEDLINAVKREVCEETAWQFAPEYLLGVQLWRKDSQSTTFLRVCFAGKCYDHNPEQALDTGIIATHWLSYSQLLTLQHKLRSPLVLASIKDYLDGQHYPLSLLSSWLDEH